MSHYLRSGAAASNRGVARSGGVWEVVGILGAVIPCGILAGLYLATEDILFLMACFGFAIVAFGLVFARNLGSLSLLRRRGGVVDAEHLPFSGVKPLQAPDGSPRPQGDTLAAMEAAHIQRVLRRTGGVKRQVAQILGISRTRLDRLIEKHGLTAR